MASMLVPALNALQIAYKDLKESQKIPRLIEVADNLLLATQSTIETFQKSYSERIDEFPGLVKPMEHLVDALKLCKERLTESKENALRNAALASLTGGGSKTEIQEALGQLKAAQENFQAHLTLKQTVLQHEVLAQFHEQKRAGKLEEVAAMVEHMKEDQTEIVDQLQLILRCIEQTHHHQALSLADLPTLRTRSLEVARKCELFFQDLQRIPQRFLPNFNQMASSFQDILKDVQANLKSLKLQLCFVGPMKAGKSTVINAICGKQLLPSAQFAMTVLPTFLVHTPGVKQPRLLFPGADAFTPALEELKELANKWHAEKRISELRKKGKEPLPEFVESEGSEEEEKKKPLDQIILTPDEEQVLEALIQGKFSHELREAEGFEPVHKVLQQVNHAARLFARFRDHMKEEPLKHLSSPESESWFPRIEMEFEMLQKMEGATDIAKFLIVDTPGRDEADLIPEIPLIFSQVLKTSTGAVCVCNAQLLNNDAQASINRDLTEMKAKHLPFFVLANKFDQLEQQRDSLSKEDLEAHMAKQWLGQENWKAHKRVFALSGEKAFLSSRVASLLKDDPKKFIEEVKAQEDRSPSKQSTSKQSTVRQWLQVAFGDAGASVLKSLSDPGAYENILKEANQCILKHSHFQDFVTEIVEKFAPQAGRQVLRSCLKQLHHSLVVHVRKEVSNLFQVLQMDKLQLQQEIKNNQRIKEAVEQQQQQAKSEMSKVIDSLKLEVALAMKKRKDESPASVITPTEADLRSRQKEWPWLRDEHVGEELIIFFGTDCQRNAEELLANSWKVVKKNLNTSIIADMQCDLQKRATIKLQEWILGCIKRMQELEQEVCLQVSQVEKPDFHQLNRVEFSTPGQVAMTSETRRKQRTAWRLWLFKKHMKDRDVTITPVSKMKNSFNSTIEEQCRAWVESMEKHMEELMQEKYEQLERTYLGQLSKYTEQLHKVSENEKGKGFEYLTVLRTLLAQIQNIDMEITELSKLTEKGDVEEEYCQQVELGQGGLAAADTDSVAPPPCSTFGSASPVSPVNDVNTRKVAHVQNFLNEPEMSETVRESFAENSVDGKVLAGLSVEEPTALKPAVPLEGAPSEKEPTESADVRSMHWYSHYIHTVFNAIYSCIMDDQATGAVLIGIQPDLDREMTCLEWPCLQQDLHSAFKKKKHPFFWKGVSRIDIKQIEIKRVHLDSLRDELKVSTTRNRCAIIASCCEVDFDAAAAAIDEHNASRPADHGKAKRAWATAEDEYGKQFHPRTRASRD
ncbi:unnamed protein product [Durusdinium trenchii]|uniref:Dynamin N-terminal domain-containing protein n=1 Tax=Durusdinium trenchii TaxID=1381693 RepID=A0ABP0QTD1_9DINO